MREPPVYFLARNGIADEDGCLRRCACGHRYGSSHRGQLEMIALYGRWTHAAGRGQCFVGANEFRIPVVAAGCEHHTAPCADPLHTVRRRDDGAAHAAAAIDEFRGRALQQYLYFAVERRLEQPSRETRTGAALVRVQMFLQAVADEAAVTHLHRDPLSGGGVAVPGAIG